jgi:hypothetical protein
MLPPSALRVGIAMKNKKQSSAPFDDIYARPGHLIRRLTGVLSTVY